MASKSLKRSGFGSISVDIRKPAVLKKDMNSMRSPMSNATIPVAQCWKLSIFLTSSLQIPEEKFLVFLFGYSHVLFLLGWASEHLCSYYEILWLIYENWIFNRHFLLCGSRDCPSSHGCCLDQFASSHSKLSEQSHSIWRNCNTHHLPLFTSIYAPTQRVILMGALSRNGAAWRTSGCFINQNRYKMGSN